MHERLKKISAMVKEGMITADIGTDHALLPVMLIKDNKVPYAYACDIAEGPLQKAEETIAQNHMEDRIKVIQSDGFDNVPPDARCAVIAGMGYETAAGILERAGERLKDFRQILLEIHDDAYLMRRWINDHHCQIDDEAFIKERNHGYIIISMDPSRSFQYTKADLIIGPVMKMKKDLSYCQWLKEQADKADQILLQSKGKAPQAELIKEERDSIRKYLMQQKNVPRI